MNFIFVVCFLLTFSAAVQTKECQVNCIISPCNPLVNPCGQNEQCIDDCCQAKCSACPTPLVNCLVDPCSTSQNTCPKGTLCEANYCGGCNHVCRSNPACPNVKCLVNPCDPRFNPCGNNQLCTNNCCTASCSACPFPLSLCKVNPCDVLQNKCPKGTVCEANYCGGCNHICKRQKDTPMKSCYKDGTSDGKICTQAFKTFCKKGCKSCCLNNNGCIPNRIYRFTKSGDTCIGNPLPPSGICRKSYFSFGKDCLKVSTVFCNKNCRKCCTNPNSCPPSKTMQFRKIDGKCIDTSAPKPSSPLTKCIVSPIKVTGQLCGQAITTFCDKNCNCCKHSNTCNPDPWTYVKTEADCNKILPVGCPNGCSPIVCITTPCDACKCPP